MTKTLSEREANLRAAFAEHDIPWPPDATTATKSLSERLRKSPAIDPAHGEEAFILNECLRHEAADALDAKDDLIKRLRAELAFAEHDIPWPEALDAKDAEIELMKEGRQLHDELVDHLEHVIAQAAAALEIADEAINPSDRSGISMDTWNKRLKEGTTAIREALAAISANNLKPE